MGYNGTLTARPREGWREHTITPPPLHNPEGEQLSCSVAPGFCHSAPTMLRVGAGLCSALSTFTFIRTGEGEGGEGVSRGSKEGTAEQSHHRHCTAKGQLHKPRQWPRRPQLQVLGTPTPVIRLRAPSPLHSLQEPHVLDLPLYGCPRLTAVPASPTLYSRTRRDCLVATGSPGYDGFLPHTMETRTKADVKPPMGHRVDPRSPRCVLVPRPRQDPETQTTGNF